MTAVVILGTGGHARACLDVLLSKAELDAVGCLGGPPTGPLQVPYLGDDSRLKDLLDGGVRRVFVAVGDNEVRRRLVAMAVGQGLTPVSLESSAASISPRCSVGLNVLVMPGAAVNAYASLADGCIVNTGATVDHDCQIGAFAHVAPGSHLAGGVKVGDGALVGIGASILPGCEIGTGAIVGAGAVVIRNVPPSDVVVGVPARSTKES